MIKESTGGAALARRTAPKGRAAGLGTALALTTALVMWSAGAQAVPFSSDIAMTGEIAFDDSFALAAGDVTQNAFMRATQGGATTVGTIVGDAQTAGPNPIAATLTDIGDGFNISAGSLGVFSAQDGAAEMALGFDFSLGVANNSASDSYRITFRVDLDRASVQGSGPDAFADSELVLELDLGSGPSEVFFSDIVSDSVNGDEQDGAPLGTAGASVADSDLQFLEVILAPGEAALFEAFWTMEGGAFDVDSVADARMNFIFSIADVENLTPPAPVPEPGTLALLGVGLLGLGALSRRGRRREV